MDEALLRYGRHEQGCPDADNDPPWESCTCGWADVVAGRAVQDGLDPETPSDHALIEILGFVRNCAAFKRIPVDVRDGVNWAWTELRRRNDPDWLAPSKPVIGEVDQ